MYKEAEYIFDSFPALSFNLKKNILNPPPDAAKLYVNLLIL
jgi:hypothetical protein